MTPVLFEAITKSVDETFALGEKVARLLRADNVVLLRGDLGAGKTAFTKGICSAFGIPREDVTSPTYSLVQSYQTRSNEITEIHHLDLYRLGGEHEFQSLAFDELRTNASLVVVEWAERVPLLNNDALALSIEIVEMNETRHFTFRGNAEYLRLKTAFAKP